MEGDPCDCLSTRSNFDGDTLSSFVLVPLVVLMVLYLTILIEVKLAALLPFFTMFLVWFLLELLSFLQQCVVYAVSGLSGTEEC